MIGAISDIVFEASTEKVRTFDGLSFSHSANFAEHSVLNRTALLEFTGHKPSTCSMTITLSSSLGVDVKEELSELKKILEAHEPFTFMLGSEIQGRNQWVLESMTEKYEVVGKDGRIESASVSLTLKEYMNE